MVNYISKRILGIIPLLFGITILSFCVIHLAPGSPTDIALEMKSKVSLEAKEKLVKLYNLDRPVFVQYWLWLERVVRFDFGNSFVDGRKVTDKIKDCLPVTVSINLIVLFLIFLLSIPIGIQSAVARGSLFDKLITVVIFLGFAMPSFWLALLLQSKIGVQLGWLPILGLKSINFEALSPLQKSFDLFRHLILPISVATIGSLAGISRYMRQGMLQVLSEDYIRTAQAFGLPRFKIIYNYALRNALLPIVTILGLSIPGLISSSVIFEYIFSIPGMGRLMYEAVLSRDYNVIMAELVIATFLTLLGNLIADIAYAYADPRIKYDKKR